MGYVGIDLGTSAVKISYIDEEARILLSITKDYPICYPEEGWAEQNPEDWWDAIRQGMQEIVDAEVFTGLDAIGFGGQMHGLVALDVRGEVIRPAILWNDTRTAKETAILNTELGKEVLLKETGNIAYAGFTAPKLLWMRTHEPERFAKIEHILLPKDYILYRLSGEFSTDYSDASGTLLLNVAQRKWSKRMCDFCGVRPSQLPTLHESGDCVGKLRDEWCTLWGLDKAPDIVAGAGDNAAAAVSVGVVEEGDCNISLGTSGTIFMPTNRFLQDEHASLHAFADAAGKFHLMGCTLSAASCYKWWMGNVLQRPENTSLSTEESVRHHPLYFMPYLMGERSPLNDEDVRAGFLGLSSRSNWEQMIYAIYEGVAFSLRDCMAVAKNMGVTVNKASIVGGGAQSRIWCQMIANVLQIPIAKPAGECGPGYGAALLAMAHKKGRSVREVAKQYATFEEIFTPQPEEIPYYEEKYRKFSQLYPLLKDFYKGL
ncbi:xylulokinase [Murdochiella vaginalis]|uniref:xylulokinase n=1 Tax=Murdochiella vaginalis TaxID=1852373 RepID=UPI0008FDC286|nr:xylulokinase [Murdochiella vaginalis]